MGAEPARVVLLAAQEPEDEGEVVGECEAAMAGVLARQTIDGAACGPPIPRKPTEMQPTCRKQRSFQLCTFWPLPKAFVSTGCQDQWDSPSY
uniref:Uncharacterized protein n=1 Tax=Oryza glumipatula TaxID=40148 RepID=A0A0D9ZKN4_9ORYZ